MILFPAVDLQDGKAVRLRKGLATDVTVFSDDPAHMALHWQAEGAQYLHLVDLDGAFRGEDSPNTPIVQKICQAIGIPVQLGGGIRDEATAKRWLDAGVTRLIIGTMALEEPKMFAHLCKSYPGQIGVSLDVAGGTLKTRGWVGETSRTIADELPRLADVGTAFMIYTDIDRDGMQTGVNLSALTTLATTSPIPVIAAGGVASIEDIKHLYPLSQTANLEGAICGRAIYEGSLRLREAAAWLAEQK